MFHGHLCVQSSFSFKSFSVEGGPGRAELKLLIIPEPNVALVGLPPRSLSLVLDTGKVVQPSSEALRVRQSGDSH